jgi:hypothetical protein
MKFLTPDQTLEIFKDSGFMVSTEEAWYRIELGLSHEIAKGQKSVSYSSPPSSINSVAFAQALNTWFGLNTSRLLWVSHWSSDFPSLGNIFLLTRQALGENRSLSEVPGHLFPPLRYGDEDISALPANESQEISLLSSMVALVILSDWDGWLVSQGSTNRIEFLEGNILFHSNDSKMLRKAEEIMDTYRCKRL